MARPFQLGDWQVNPSTGHLTLDDGETLTIRPKVMELLVYLVSRAGELVSNDDLIINVWEGVHVSESSLYYTMNKLRAALGDDRQKPAYIETIPKRGYRLIAKVEFTDSSLCPKSNVTEEFGFKKQGLLMGLLVIGIIAIALIAFFNRASYAPTDKMAKPNSIAVLPFINMSDDPNNEYFSDGIAEEILNMLAQIPDLRVTSRSSAFQFRGDNIDIPTVGAQLGVATVLEGSIRRSGTRLRIAAQLIDARTDEHLWSEIYDRELDDIFIVQDEIASSIVKALRSKLAIKLSAPKEKTIVANRQAYEAYLRGRYLVVQRSKSTIEGAVREFKKAIELEPNYALAHAELANAIMFLVRSQYGSFSNSEALNLAIPYLERALDLGPGLAQTQAAAGQILAYQQKPEEGVEHYRYATSLNPNYGIVHSWMANLLQESLGGYKESFEARDMALQLDPLSKPAMYHKIRELIARDSLTEADLELEKLSSIAPAFHAHALGQRRSIGGLWSNAVLGNLDALQISPNYSRSRFYLTYEFAKLGLPEEAHSIFYIIPPAAFSRLGLSQKAVMSAEKWSVAEPDELPPIRELSIALAGAGDYVRAKPLLEELWKKSRGIVSSTGMFQITHASALIALYRALGNQAGASEVLEAMRAEAGRLRGAGITRTAPGIFPYSADAAEGMTAFLSGEREKGLALIAEATQEGHYIWPNQAYWQVLYDDPGFAPIMASQKARQARERKKLLYIVCAKNPYDDIWQPSEGTCETFLSALG